MKPLHILLVEDNEGDVILTTETLYDCNFPITIKVVKDGWEAIRLLNKKEVYEGEPIPNLIILDLNLPKMNGAEVLETIKSNSTLMHIPVMILSTSAFEKDIQLCLQQQANCFITKPLETAIFINKIMAIEELCEYVTAGVSGST